MHYTLYGARMYHRGDIFKYSSQPLGIIHMCLLCYFQKYPEIFIEGTFIKWNRSYTFDGRDISPQYALLLNIS